MAVQTTATSYPTISARPAPAAKSAAVPAGGRAGVRAGASSGVDHAAVRATVGRMPAPTSNPYAAAQSIVSGELSPILHQLLAGYTAQGASGAAAIKAVTDAYAKQLAGIEPAVAADYSRAEQGTAATDASLASLVNGAGTADATSLASRLASIGQPDAVNPVVQQLGQQAGGAAAGVYGGGSAALDALLAGGAAQEASAAKLPAFARETGIQQLGSYQGALTAAENKDVAALTDKAPGLEQSAASTIIGSQDKAAALQGENNRAAASIKAANARSAAGINGANDRANLAAATQQRKIAVATILAAASTTGTISPAQAAALQKLGLPVQAGDVSGSVGAGIIKSQASAAAKSAHDAVLENQGWARVQISQQNANTSAGRLQLAKAKQAAASGKGQGALTQHEVATLVQGWHDGKIKNVRIPAIDPTTGKQAVNINNVPQYSTVNETRGAVSYNDAVVALEALGKTHAQAVAAVNGFYAPGFAGRPWESKAVAAALAKAGPQVNPTTGAVTGGPGGGTSVRVLNGHQVLDPAQYQALKSAGLLPVGQLTAEGYYVVGGTAGGS